MSGSHNKKIADKKPSQYLKMMPRDDKLKDILDSAFCPSNTFDDNFKAFIDARVELLLDFARKLIQDNINNHELENEPKISFRQLPLDIAIGTSTFGSTFLGNDISSDF